MTAKDEVPEGMIAWYDETARQEALWGEHLHHGYYGLDEEAHISTNRAAEQRVVEKALEFANISDDPLKRPKNIIDVGCGFGGAAIYLAKRYGAKCCGINLSTGQIEKAKQLAAANGLEDQVSFIVGNALNQPFPDGQFDLVWTMECIEHITDKLKFIHELARIAAPGATIIIVASCHRDLVPGEETLQPDEMELLNKICRTIHLAPHCSPSDIVKIAQSLAFQNIKIADWSENVAPYFRSMSESKWTWQGFTSLLLNGWSNAKVTLIAIPAMLKAYEEKVAKYTAVVLRKPE